MKKYFKEKYNPHYARMLKAARERNNLTLIEVAEATGFSTMFISFVERKERHLPVNLAKKLCALYKINVASIIFFDPPDPKPSLISETKYKKALQVVNDYKKQERNLYLAVPGIDYKKGFCMSKPCVRYAYIDANGCGYFLCKPCYDSFSDFIDDEYA